MRCWGWIIRRNDSKWLSLEQIRAFLAGAAPELRQLGQGKIKRVYRRWATPYERLREAAGWEKRLRPEITAAHLHTQAGAQTDTEAAILMQEAKRDLFRRIVRKIA